MLASAIGQPNPPPRRPDAEEPAALDGLRHLAASSRLFRGLRAGLSPWELVMWQLPGGGVREGAALEGGS